MNSLKKILIYFSIVFSIITVVVYSTGNQHLFKAVASTYLIGKTGPSIDEYDIFNNRKIEKGKHQEWKLSSTYNSKIEKKLLGEIEKYEPVAFLVAKKNEIVFEKYWDGYNENSLSNSFSVAKTFVGLLVGIAIDEGKINSENDPVGMYLPQYKDNPELKIKDLLTMSSGINFDENYNSPIGHMAKAYYGNDLKQLNKTYKVTDTPGKKHEYRGGNTLILSFLVEKVTGMSISEYMSKKVWKPIGSKNDALWNLDKEGGTEKSYCCFYSNARDFARIGQLYLNNGMWNGKRVITQKYIEATKKPAYYLKNKQNKPVDFYGYHMWMSNYKGIEIFYARGILGQFIIFVPEKEIVIVRLGHKRGPLLENNHPSDFYAYLDLAFLQ